MSGELVGIRISLNSDTIFVPEFTSRTLVRAYVGSADVSISASGSQLMTGPSRRQQFVWTIGALMTKADALIIDKIFRDWDLARAGGGTPAVLVEDNTFGESLSTYATFSTPPQFTYYSAATVAIDFGLTEVI